MTASPLFPVTLVMLALDEHDPSVLDALIAGAPGLGCQTLVLAHVSPLDPLAGTLGMGLSFDDGDVPDALEAARARVAAALPGVDVKVEHGRGAVDSVFSDIIARHDVDLLVIGRLQTGETTNGWGPSGRKLLRTASCSTLLVPEGASLEWDHVVAGLDFSNHAAYALSVACRLSDNVTAICQYDLRAAGHGSLTDEQFASELEKNARDHFQRAVAPDLPEGANPTLEIHPGDRASDVLFDRAGDDVLVVGSRGLSKLATLLLGSTAERLAGRSKGPVLIVRKKGEVLGLLEGLFHR